MGFTAETTTDGVTERLFTPMFEVDSTAAFFARHLLGQA
jgi:hypothetical protein